MAELPHQALVRELVERERRLQSELTARMLAPVDAIFDMLEETGSTLRRQAEALEAAGRALEESGRLARRQAELFERTIGTMRRPADVVRAAAGVEARSRDA